MNYQYIIAGIGLIILGCIMAAKMRKSKIICPNCSPRKTFADEERVGLCKSCAKTHEFIPFSSPKDKQFGVVAMKMPIKS